MLGGTGEDVSAAYDRDVDESGVGQEVPEFVVRRWWQQILHNQTALFLKGRLLFREGVVVTSVPYHLRAHDSQDRADSLITRAGRED